MARPANEPTRLHPVPRARPLLLEAVWSAALVLLGMGLASASAGSEMWLFALSSALARVISGGVLALVYVLAAWGLGIWLLRVTVPASARAQEAPLGSLSLGLGLSAQLTLTHLAGWAGQLRLDGGGVVVAWGLLVPGLCVLGGRVVRVVRVVRGGGGGDGGDATALLGAQAWWMDRQGAWGRGIVLVLVGVYLGFAASTPGFLWASEFGGFDALSYHLQLPGEWLREGGLRPLEHNVYSYLPSYLEAAFMHVRALVAGGGEADSGGAVMLARGGIAVFSAQMLHALLAIGAALATGGLARRIWGGTDTAGWVAAGLVLATPWTLVVGTLAYNEMGVALLAACAGGVAMRREWSLLRRTVVCAVLVGAACGIKPTALQMVGVPLGGVLLLMLVRDTKPQRLGQFVHRGAKVFGLGALTGVVMLLPWMIRNSVTSGNPVFPFANAIFAGVGGSMGHWSSEQVARFAAGHRFAGTWGDRLALMVKADATDPMGMTFRGLTHPQWSITLVGALVVGLVVVGIGIVHRRGAIDPARRARMGVVLGVLVMQLALWLMTTHVQSRFLLPLVVPACVVWAGALMLLTRDGTRRTLVGAGAVAIMSVGSIAWSWGGLGMTGVGLVMSPEARTGSARLLRGTPPETWTSEQAVNMLPTGSLVLLVGESTPLFYRTPVRYATTWDTNPIALLTGQAQATWTSALRQGGFTHVLVNFAELERLGRSGFLDPRLEPADLAAWARTQQIVGQWPATGQVLLKL